MTRQEKITKLYEKAQFYFNNGIEKGDNGNNGKALEILVKLALNNFNFSGVSKNGRVDTIKNGVKYEIKTNCGELATLDENGEIIKSSLLKSDYIIYSMDYSFDNNATFLDILDDVLFSFYVIPVTDFMEILKDNGLLRTKKSTYAIRNNLSYNDRLTIQSYKNSKKKYDAFFHALANYPILFDIVQQ